MFPHLDGHAVTHVWGGALGITRDRHASVGLDGGTSGWPARAGGRLRHETTHAGT
jgi:hypothetical protein